MSASALTLSTLGALVPLGVVSLSILTSVPSFEGLAEKIQNFIFQNFVPTASETIQYHLSRFVAKASQLRFIGISVFVLTALLLIGLVDNALNEIWGVERRRRGAKAFLVYWTLLTLGPLLLGLSVGFTSYFGSLLAIPETFRRSGFQEFFYAAVPFTLTVSALTLTYFFVPKRRVRFAHAFGSALAAAVLFEIAKQGFTLYVAYIPAYEVVYGTLAVVPLFLLWLYLSWTIVLLGAEMAHCLQTFEQGGLHRPISRYILGLTLLYYFWQGHRGGETFGLTELSKKLPAIREADIMEILKTLRKAELVGQLNNGDYVLRKDLGRLTLHQLYRVTPWRLPGKDQVDGLESPSFIQEGLRPLLARTETSLFDVLAVSVESVFKAESSGESGDSKIKASHPSRQDRV